ncbi:hypothetical protein ON010_g5047 [Phytophthora cinnamomi]|nr:hypothetical protein ON010_g5047 [Phytophthora cinnamomi]
MRAERGEEAAMLLSAYQQAAQRDADRMRQRRRAIRTLFGVVGAVALLVGCIAAVDVFALNGGQRGELRHAGGDDRLRRRRRGHGRRGYRHGVAVRLELDRLRLVLAQVVDVVHVQQGQGAVQAGHQLLQEPGSRRATRAAAVAAEVSTPPWGTRTLMSARGETPAVPVGPNREGTTPAQANKRRPNSAIVVVCAGDPHLTIFVCSATPHNGKSDSNLLWPPQDLPPSPGSAKYIGPTRRREVRGRRFSVGY